MSRACLQELEGKGTFEVCEVYRGKLSQGLAFRVEGLGVSYS